MPQLSVLLTFALATVALLVLPGPAVMYIVTRSASQGRRAGLVSVAGIHTGTLVHIAAAMIGLSAIVAASATAFGVVKLAGAAYLCWLGARSLWAARRTQRDTAAVELARPAGTLRRVYLDGALVNVLNPKVAIFFLSFVPQFVDPSAERPALQIAVLGAVFVLLGLVSDGLYAALGGWLGGHLRRSASIRRRTDAVAGGIYLGLGALTAVGGRSD